MPDFDDEVPESNEEDDMFLAMFGDQVDPDAKAKYLAERDKAEMALMAARHAFFSTIESLNQEQLTMFRDMMLHFAQMADSPTALLNLIGWYQGHFQAMLQTRFNECPSCKVNHEEELTKNVGGTP